MLSSQFKFLYFWIHWLGAVWFAPYQLFQCEFPTTILFIHRFYLAGHPVFSYTAFYFLGVILTHWTPCFYALLNLSVWILVSSIPRLRAMFFQTQLIFTKVLLNFNHNFCIFGFNSCIFIHSFLFLMGYTDPLDAMFCIATPTLWQAEAQGVFITYPEPLRADSKARVLCNPHSGYPSM